MVGGGLQYFSVSPSPLGTNLGYELVLTKLGLGLGGLRTIRVFGQGLAICFSVLCAASFTILKAIMSVSPVSQYLRKNWKTYSTCSLSGSLELLLKV